VTCAKLNLLIVEGKKGGPKKVLILCKLGHGGSPNDSTLKARWLQDRYTYSIRMKLCKISKIVELQLFLLLELFAFPDVIHIK
jgi:hypothetical protein